MSDIVETLEKQRDQVAELLAAYEAQLRDWQHYASYLANHAAKGAPSFAEWKQLGGGG